MNSLTNLAQAADTLKGSDLTWAYDVIDSLKNNPQAINDFEKDPNFFIKQLGHDIPEGFHVHYIDEQGNYFPNETVLTPTDDGSRLEARIDKGNVALGVCVYCPNGCGSKGGLV